jgi:hypothetical protein
MTEQEAIATLERLGVETLERDATIPGRPVVVLSLWCKAGDADLVCLSALPHVRWLSLRFTRATDAVFEHLRNWEYLDYLDCAQTLITGHGVRALHPNAPLKTLDLGGDAFDAKSLAVIIARPTIEHLLLPFTRIEHADLHACVQLPRLQKLNLNYTSLSDAALTILGNVKALHVLSLSGTLVSDEGLRNILSLQHLEELYLSNCSGVTNKGLDYVVKLPALRQVTVDGTSVTRDAVSKVVRKLRREGRKRLAIIINRG